MEVPEIRRCLGQSAPVFRARQIYEGIYRQRASGLQEIPSLPSTLRETLEAGFRLGRPRVETVFRSADGTRRYLLRLEDRKTVEAVIMPEDGRSTLCISTQVGCPVGCKFCLTARMGLERNLTAGEIVGQVLSLLADSGLSPGRDRINIVLMGMGEPLLNLPAVLKATRILVDPRGVGISPRRITLSTAGIIPKIHELGKEIIRPRLAISLNASTEEQRRRLMRITRKYSLGDLLEACRAYPLRSWERLTFEYALLKGVNDSDADARRVVRLLAGLKCKVNLIALNPGPGIPFETPEPERVLSFQGILRRSVPCFVRKPRGRDIFAACGQLKRVSIAAAEPAADSGPPGDSPR